MFVSSDTQPTQSQVVLEEHPVINVGRLEHIYGVPQHCDELGPRAHYLHHLPPLIPRVERHNRVLQACPLPRRVYQNTLVEIA